MSKAYQTKEDFGETARLWLKAMANVFYNGDEEAAWQDVFETAKEHKKNGWLDGESSKDHTVHLALKIKP